MGYAKDPEVCPICGYDESIRRTSHNHTCEKVRDSPFTGQVCAMCEQPYESYLDHLKVCPAANG